jgi:hypothetical protein
MLKSEEEILIVSPVILKIFLSHDLRVGARTFSFAIGANLISHFLPSKKRSIQFLLLGF